MIDAHHCSNGRKIRLYPEILCSLCVPGSGSFDIQMDEEEIKRYNMSKQNWRKIHIENKEWEYIIGRFNITIKIPGTNEKAIKSYEEVTGRDLDTIFGGHGLGDGTEGVATSDGMIKPSEIKDYIELHLIERAK